MLLNYLCRRAKHNTKLSKLSNRNIATLKNVTIAFLQERCYLKERYYIISLQVITTYIKDASIIFLLELYYLKERYYSYLAATLLLEETLL
jgi:hypothetical protein